MGNGKGLKKVTKPRAKDAHKPKDRHLALRGKPNLANVPSAELANIDDSEKVFTEKALVFIKHWAEGDSVPVAATKAGYGDGAVYAYKLTKLPRVQAMYAEVRKKYEESVQMTRQRVMEGFLEGIEMAKMIADPATVIKGWSEVAKMCGYYADKKLILQNPDGTPIASTVRNLKEMSDEELAQMAALGAAAQARLNDHVGLPLLPSQPAG